MRSSDSVVRAGYAAPVTPVVENITGRKPISFIEFAPGERDGVKIAARLVQSG